MALFKKKNEDGENDGDVELETFDGDVLLAERADRRILPDVPDPTGQRSAMDRRGAAEGDDIDAIMQKRKSGIRYRAKFPVTIDYDDARGRHCTLKGSCRDISDTGILVAVDARGARDEDLDRGVLRPYGNGRG